MKRYIFFYALSMLFFSAMNFGMDKTSSSKLFADKMRFAMYHGIPTDLVDKNSEFGYVDGQILLVLKKEESTYKRRPKLFKPKLGKPLQSLKKVDEESMDISK